MPFIEEILNNTQSIICDLQPQQVDALCYANMLEIENKLFLKHLREYIILHCKY